MNNAIFISTSVLAANFVGAIMVCCAYGSFSRFRIMPIMPLLAGPLQTAKTSKAPFSLRFAIQTARDFSYGLPRMDLATIGPRTGKMGREAEEEADQIPDN